MPYSKNKTNKKSNRIMSEYTNVEHPFLEKLREIGWKVIDKGSGGGKGTGEILEGKEGVDGKVVEQK